MSNDRTPQNPGVRRNLFGAQKAGKELSDDLAKTKKALTDFHYNVKKAAQAQGHCEDSEATSAPGTPEKPTSVKPTFGKK